MYRKKGKVQLRLSIEKKNYEHFKTWCAENGFQYIRTAEKVLEKSMMDLNKNTQI